MGVGPVQLPLQFAFLTVTGALIAPSAALNAGTFRGAARAPVALPSKNAILPLQLAPPTHGARLTASHCWKEFSPVVQELPADQRMQLMKAGLIAFISLNDHWTDGQATILKSISKAKAAVRHSSERWDTTASATELHELTVERRVAHVTAVLLHEAIATGKLSPDDPSQVLCFGDTTARLAKLTAVAHLQTAFHASVYRALAQHDGWGAAMLLEARGELLSDADDVELCREAVRWSEQHCNAENGCLLGDHEACPELRASLYATLRAVERRQAAAVQASSSSAVTTTTTSSSAFSSTRRRRRTSAMRMQMEPPEEVECDVVIVGGGPAGCTCALYTSRANLKTVMLDKNPATGALAITSHIANYPGVDKTMSGQALLDLMREQAIDYGTDYRRAQVFLVEVDGEQKVVYTPDATFRARALVLATGAMGRPPSFKGEDTFLGKGVSYCATCDGAFYQGSEVAVVGNNLEAMEEAQFLTKFASTVHWITAADPKPGDVHAEDLLACDNVKHWSKTHMECIEGDASGVTGIKLRSAQAGEAVFEDLAVEGVFIYVAGSKPITDFLENCVELNKDGGVKVNDEMATSAQGVFAIGDIRNTPYKQVVVAASDGCIAAMSIDCYLKGRKNVRVDWIHQ